jgi:hypothetical protein
LEAEEPMMLHGPVRSGALSSRDHVAGIEVEVFPGQAVLAKQLNAPGCGVPLEEPHFEHLS